LQTVVRMLDYDQQPQAACCAPRWKVNRDFTLDLETGISEQVAQVLSVSVGDVPGQPLAPRPTGDFVFNAPSSLLFAPVV
ncbi:MAG: hypothetical protein ACTS5Y_07105, partial [Pollutimonas bauzanensis]